MISDRNLEASREGRLKFTVRRQKLNKDSLFAGRAGSGGCPESRPRTRAGLRLSLKKSTLPQNRQLDISISNSKQEVDDFVGELTFEN